MDLLQGPPDGPRKRWFEGGLRFTCTGCGRCCTGASGTVHLTNVDLDRLAIFYQMPVGRFARRYTHMIKGRRSLINGPASHDCIFLNGKTCTVYESRPTQCRTYPWWPANINDQESWEEAGKLCEGINHLTAPIVPSSEILAAWRMDVANESSVETQNPHARRR